MLLAHRFAAALGTLALSASAAQAAVVYQFTLDTSSIAGAAGYLDLQVGNGGGPATFQDFFAKVSNFQTDGVLGSEDPYATQTLGQDDVLGHVSGTLPSTVILSDLGDTAVSDYFHGFTFGNSLSFRVTLSGPAIDAPACGPGGNCAAHVFAFDMFDTLFNPLFTDPNDINSYGFLAGRIDVAGDGAITPASFSRNLSITAVPEPRTWGLMICGFAAAGAVLRRKRQIGLS